MFFEQVRATERFQEGSNDSKGGIGDTNFLSIAKEEREVNFPKFL